MEKDYIKKPLENLMLIMAVLLLFTDCASAAERIIDVSEFNNELKITPESGTRKKTYLNGEWGFYPVKGVDEYKIPENLPENVEWQTILVPSDWKSTVNSREWYHQKRYFGYPAQWTNCPAAWYKKEIVVSDKMKGKRVLLDFQAVNHFSVIYVNGSYAGKHEDGITPFQIDITDLVSYGKKNIIHVYVVDQSPAIKEGQRRVKQRWRVLYDRPVYLFQFYSGIWQDVSLKIVPQIYIEDIWIVTSLRKKEIRVSLDLIKKLKTVTADRIRVSVLNKELKEILVVADKKIEPDKRTLNYHYASKWSDPELWWPENPYLYVMKVELFRNDELIDQKYKRFGFREFWTDGDDFKLNGKKIHLWGETMDIFKTTLFPRPEYIRTGVRYLKSLGVNCIRDGMIYANGGPAYAYDIFDEEGLMVIPTVGVNHYSNSIIKETRSIIKERIRALRNHPSIIMWSSENEAFKHTKKRFKKWNENIMELTKVIMDFDSTRPVTGDGGRDYFGMLPVMNMHYPGQNNAMGMQINAPARWKYDKPVYIGEHLYMGRWVEAGPGIERWLGDYVAYARYDLWPEKYYEIYSGITKVWRSYGLNMMIFGSGRASYMQSVFKRNRQYRLYWGDTNTPYLKPPYMFKSINPGYLKDKPVAIPDKRFDALKDISAPLAVSIWRDWEHNFISGEKIKKEIWIINHTMEKKENLKIRYSLNPAETYQELHVTAAPQGESVHTGNINITAPDVIEKQRFRLIVDLLDRGTVINRDWMYVTVFPDPEFDKSIIKDKKILLYDTKGITSESLTRAGIEYSEFLPGKTELDMGTDLLIIGYGSADKRVYSKKAGIDDYIKNGGKMLIFEQNRKRIKSRSIAFITAPGHPVFKGVSQDRFFLWSAEKGVIFNEAELLPAEVRHRSLVSAGGIGGHLGMRHHADGKIYSVLLEKLIGNGVVLSCNLMVSKRYGKDPESTILVNNMIEYLLTLPPREEKKTGYIGINTKTNILDDMETDYDRIRIDQIDDYDIVVLGQNLIGKKSEIIKEKEKILDYVGRGGTIICLMQDPKKWTDDWLPEVIELEDHPHITRGIANPHKLAFGVRRVLFDPGKRLRNGVIFRNHFVVKKATGWKKVIESAALEEQAENGTRSVHMPTGGAMVVELRQGQGKYVLSQIPYGKNQNQWINEATVQIMTNAGISFNEFNNKDIF